jgi:hypothetical protein
MNQEIRIRTIESTEELDQNTLYGLIYLTNHLPESSGLRGGSHTEIQDTLENFVDNESRRAALIIAEREPLGRAVGYIATQIDPEGHGMAEVKQLAVVPENDDAKEVGNLLIEQAETWGEQHEARVTVPSDIEFTGKLVGKQVLEVIASKYTIATHPAIYLG